jgi:Cu+-exporting ATPase
VDLTEGWGISTLILDGMTCKSCTQTVKTAIQGLEGVKPESVKVELKPMQLLEVVHQINVCSWADLKTKVEDLGFLVLSSPLTHPIDEKGTGLVGSSTGVDAGTAPAPAAGQNKVTKVRTEFTVHGMTCASCVGGLEGMLKAIRGVDAETVTVTLLPQKALVVHDPTIISAADVASKIEDMGYEVLKYESVNLAPAPKTTTQKTENAYENEGDANVTITIPEPSSVTTRLSVTGMTCASCVTAIENALRRKNGIKDVNVSLLNHKVNSSFGMLNCKSGCKYNKVLNGLNFFISF